MRIVASTVKALWYISKIILYESIAIIVGMLFLPRLWILMWRMQKGNPTKREIAFVQSYKSDLRETREYSETWANFVAGAWLAGLILLQYQWLGSTPVWLTVISGWITILALTTILLNRIVKRSTL